MYSHLLVPIDESPLSRATVESAVDFASHCGARITFFHACSDFGASSDGAVLHALSPADFVAQAAGHTHGLLGKAAAAALARKVESSTVWVTSDEVAHAILRSARERDCDLIFMASHGERGVKRLLHGSVTHKLLELADVAVLVAAVESNLTVSDESRAMAILKDEHRSLAAALQGLRHTAKRCAQGDDAVDFRLLRALLFYIETFPQRLHHPKEEQTLFRLLRSRTDACDHLLDELERQHQDGQAEFERLAAALDAWEHRQSPAGFVAGVEAFAMSQWTHMSREERELFPAASDHLTPQDWSEVMKAFAGNDDPGLHDDLAESYTRLFARLLTLAASS